MKSLDILRREHALIRRILNICEVMADALDAGGDPSGKDLSALLDFFHGFADVHHHRKEEFLLFPWLKNHGIPVRIGPVACMHLDHERTRGHLADLSRSARSPEESHQALVACLRGLSRHMRDHVDQEDEVLFRVAEDFASDDEELLHAFHEAIPDGDAVEARYRSLVEDLESRYDVPAPSVEGTSAI